MISNLEKYKNDLDRLIKLGNDICLSFKFEISLELKGKHIKDDETKKLMKVLPSFSENYQRWYSESLVILKQLLPDRVDDFIDLYKKPKTARKNISAENYFIEDALMGLEVSREYSLKDKIIIVDKKSVFPMFQQQINIIKSIKERFESSLFDIKQLVQADLFDSELDAAKELNKKGFARGAGAIAGVVLEKHLGQVCASHNVKVRKKNPTINDYNQLLKEAGVIEVKDLRFIQRLTDLRNICDHNKNVDPKKDEVKELIDGVDKISKIIF